MIEDVTTTEIEETVSTVAPITTTDVTPNELTMAQALVEIKKSKPKGATTTTITVTIPTLDSTRPKARGLKVNVVRHKLTTDVDVNAVEVLGYCNGQEHHGEAQIHAMVDGKKVIISEAITRGDLKFEEGGVDCLSNEVIFEQLPGYTPISHNVGASSKEELGKGLTMPFAPQHIPIIQPSTSKPQKKQKHMKQRRQDTKLPQTSVPKETVTDEADNEEMYDSLERATTTATTLDAKHNRGNISKTQSKTIPNEPISPRTSSGGGPRCQDTMKDTIAQTRSENVSKQSNNPPLSRVNTLGSGEDSLKLKEFMEICTNLQQRVIDMENIKTVQAQEISSLKNLRRREGQELMG
nr:hypothetical protein [Tanacetum cinerariifolium]